MNERLREKLIANGVRLNGIEQQKQLPVFLDSIAPALRTVLINARTHFGLDAKKFESIFPSPVGMMRDDEPPVLPSPDPVYRDTDAWEEVLETLRKLRCCEPVPGILCFDNRLPLWEVDLINYAALIADLTDYLASHKYSHFAWVGLDSRDGVVLSCYCGYLDADRRTNHDEVIHEIITWGRLLEPEVTNHPMDRSGGSAAS